MSRRIRIFFAAAAVVLALGVCFLSGTRQNRIVQSDPGEIMVYEENPDTGEFPSQLISAMLLVLGGVGISAFIDERKRRE